MKTIAKLFLASWALFLLAQPASAQAPSRPYLTGKWEGVMSVVGPQADGSPSVTPLDGQMGQYGYRLDIGATNLVMYFQSGDQWVAFGEGQDLRLNEQGRSAVVIAALPAGADQSETDTMMLNIVRWDEDTVAVYMTRVTSAADGQLAAPINSLGRLGRGNF